MPETKRLPEYSDAEFVVEEIGEGVGPDAASSRVASFLIGDPPEVRRGETDPDPIALERQIRSKAKPRCRMFHLADQVEAQAWADLEHEALVEGTAKIQKIKEVTDGVAYSLVVQWLEFEKPAEVVREDIEFVMREKKLELLRSITPEQTTRGTATMKAQSTDKCQGKTRRGKPCQRKKKIGDYCKAHAPKPRKAIAMDAPPPTHAPLGGTA